MMDPVSTIDGETFERAAIERWLKNHTTNPLTGETLAANTLVPNAALARLIKASGALDEPPAAATTGSAAAASSHAQRAARLAKANRRSVATVSSSADPDAAPPGLSRGATSRSMPTRTVSVDLSAPISARHVGVTSEEGLPPQKKTREQEFQEWKEKKPRAPSSSAVGASAASLGAPTKVVLATVVQPSQQSQPLQSRSAASANGRGSNVTAAKKGPTKRTSATSATTTGGSAASGDDIMELLRSHNSKVRQEMKSKPAYEPRTQSVTAMREWEKRTGKKYSELDHAARWAANQEINEWVAEQVAQTAA
jgi:hypothetical protein